MNTYGNATSTHTRANTVDRTMENYGDTYETSRPNDYEAPSTAHASMIGVIVCTIESTQSITNYLGLCVIAMHVENTMIGRKWRIISQNDLGNMTTVVLVGIGTVHAEDIYCIQSIQVCTGLLVMKTTA